jgi:hypothetical protein
LRKRLLGVMILTLLAGYVNDFLLKSYYEIIAKGYYSRLFPNTFTKPQKAKGATRQ